MAKNWEEYLKENIDSQSLPQWKQYIADHIPPARAGEFDPLAGENGMFNLPETMETMSARRSPAPVPVDSDFDPLVSEAGEGLVIPFVDAIAQTAMRNAPQAVRPTRRVNAMDAITTAASTGFEDFTPEQINTPVNMPALVQDAAATALAIPYTAASTGVSTANFLTGGMLDDAVLAMNEGERALRQSFGSDELNRQVEAVNAIQQDVDSNLFDVLVAAANNPRSLAYDAIRNFGTMALPTGAALGAGKLAQAAPALARYVPALERVAPWMANNAGKIGAGASMAANALMNASDTFADEDMMKRSLGERYSGAGISALISLLTGVATEGGAEGQIARRLLNGRQQEAASGALNYLKGLGKSAFKEGLQEYGEESGNYLGKVFGTNGLADFNEMNKQAGYASLLGSLTGGVSHVGTNLGGQRQQTAEPLSAIEQEMDRRMAVDALRPENAQRVVPNMPNTPGQNERIDFLSQVMTELEKIRQQNEQQVQARQVQGQYVEPQDVRWDEMPQQVPQPAVQASQEAQVSQGSQRGKDETLESLDGQRPADNMPDNPLDIIIANGGIRPDVLKKDLGWTDEEIAKLPQGVVTDDGKALLPVKRALKKAGLDTDVNAILDAASRPEAPEMDFAQEEERLLSRQNGQPVADIQQEKANSPEKMSNRLFEPESVVRQPAEKIKSENPESGIKQVMRDAVENGQSADGHIVFQQVKDTPKIQPEKQSSAVQFSGEELGGLDVPIKTLKVRAANYARKHFSDKIVTVASDGAQVLIPWQGIKHALTGQVHPVSALVTSKLDALIENGQRVGSFPDRKNRESIKAVHYYETPININGENSTIRIVVRETQDGKRYYDHFEVRGDLPSGGTEYLTGAVPGQQTSQLAKEGQPDAAENNVSRPSVKSQEETDPLWERAPSSHSVAGTPRAVSGQSGNETSVNENPSAGNETDYGTLENPNTFALSGHFKAQFESGKKYGNINQARAEVADLLNISERTKLRPIYKQIDESIELGLVRAARDIVSEDAKNHIPAVEIYRKMVRLYQDQPNLGTRTSTSVAQQAYSTPLPLSFLASRLAGIDSQTIVYEPSAGNGALLMSASPENAIVNELNPDRADRLREQGFAVTQKDASGYTPSRTPDVVIANPPFGTVRDDSGDTRHFSVLGLDTTEIDQAISLQALDTLPEDGRAVLIIGGKQGNDKARSAKYNTAAQRAFYKTLFDHFNVVDHFSVDGKLYQKQGAGYPIDFIVIDGHYPTENPVYPAGRLPQVYASFDALEEKLNGDEGAEIRRKRTDSQHVHGRRRDQIEIPSSERNGVEDGRTAGKRTGKRPVDDLQTVAGQSGESRRDDVPVEERTGRRHAADDSGSARRDGQSGVDQLPAGQPRVPAETTAAGGRRESGRTDSGRNDVGNDAAQRRLDVNKPKKSTAKGTETQRPYQTHSNGYQLGTLVPANMETPVRRALENVAEKHGDLDAFVAKELGYDSVESMQGAFAAEQVDALSLALDNIGDGKGFILGDQTGIGKGRVCAGIIRWAKQNGKTPVFVTMLPDLYADMMRDLNDIGTTDFTPFITNRNMTGKNALVAPDGSKLAAPSGRKYDTVVEDILSGKKLPEGYDAIFTTYKQLQSQKGKTNARQDILNALSDNAILILDEAHNAGGAESSIGQFIRSYTANMKNGVLYSSATFAKRPDIMSLYNKTDISKIGDQKKIQEITEKGGLPIQQAISAMLTESGQYIRREKSFEGASMETVPVNVDIRTSDRISAAMEKIMFFSSVFQNTVEEISKDLKMAGRASGMKKGVGNVGATSTSFGSVMHNLVSVSTMASKVEATIDAVERAVRNGEKPVVTLSNTLGSAIEEYARKNGLKNGEKIDLNFRDLIGTYLEKTRTIRVTEPGASESKDYYVKDKEMGSVALGAYRAARRYIDKLDISLPVSPIDAIRDGLAKRGIRAGEITGRSHGVSYETDTPSYRTREPGVAEKQKAAIGFNAGDLDCLIINQSGSTGISLHASEKFADQRRRNMIILQPDLNIDVFMQTLGRVFRTGQVVPPKYSFLLSDIPSERRPAAVLGKKMSSLNANTTASAKGTQSFANIPDFLNVYGDQAAAQVLSEDAELNARLGHPWSAEDKVLDGLVARMTGRIPLLSAKEQSDVYDRLESAYNDIIDLANATGTNILDTTSKPLDAREISEKVFSEGRKTGSPFDTESVAVTYDVKRLGKPFRSEEVKKHIAEGEKSPVRVSELEAQWRDFRDSRDGNVEFPSEARNRITNVAARLHVGAPVRVNTSNGTTVGIVVGIQNTNKKGQNPYALSRWKLVIDLADAKRRISIPFSKISMSESATEDKFSVVPFSGKSIDELYRDFDEGQSESRENRTIIIGNLVRAFDATKGRGEIITFDTSDGDRIAGLMLPRGVSETKLMEERAVPFETGNQAIRYFDRVRNTELSTEDGNLRLDNHYGYHLRTPSAKAVGGKYYLDPAILDITGDFVKSGNFMRVGLDTSQVKKIVELMAARKNPLQAEMSRDVAREVTGQGKTENAKSEPVKYSRSERQDRGMSVDELRLLADTLVESFHNAPGIVVADHPQDAIPNALPDGMGLFDPNNGKVFLFARNIRDADTARAVFAHEVIAHYGLRGFFGDSLGDVLVSIRNHNPKIEKLSQEWWSENQDYIKQVRENEGRNWTEDQFEKWQRDISIEEAMAFFAEQGERITGVKRLVRKIQELLRDITRRLGWRWPANLANWLESKTDAEALSALHQAELFVRGEISGQTITTREDIAKYRVRESEEARTGVFDATESFAVPQITILDNIIRAMQDKDIDVKRIQDSILKSGGEISENQDVYLNETLYTSRMSDRLRRLNEEWTKPILEAVQKSGLTLDEAGNWLYARHVILDDVNTKLAEINPDRDDNEALSGMSDDEAQDILARNRDNKALEKLGELSDKLARRNVMWLVNGGLITKEEGKAWASKYEHYVPLKRDSDIPETQSFGEFLKNPLYGISEKSTRRGNVSGTRNMETRGKESKRRMGSVRRATNIIANMMANATTTIMRTEKAIVGRSMLDLARTNPNPGLWTVDTPKKVKRINRETGLVEVIYRDQNMMPADNVLVVKENGVEHWIVFNKNNPRAMSIAKSMKGMDAAAMNWLTQSIGATTRYMARWITSRNPVFMLFNLQRDVQHAMFNLSDTPLSGKEGQVLKNILPAMRQYHNLLRGNGEKAGYADEFREAGAETGFVKTFESIHDHVKDLQKELDKMSRSKANPMVYVEKTVKAIDDYNNIVENGVRLAVYTVARENGLSIRQAAKIAKEITVDFNRRGTHSGFINSLYMFTNASIQGHARFIRAFAKSRKARIMSAGLVGLGFVMDMIGRALLGDDDETGLKVWDEIPEWDKERYWIFPVPKDMDEKGYIKIPMPQGLHVLPNIGRMLSELCFSSRKKSADMALRAGLLIVDAFNPFGAAASPGQFIAPTVAKPFIQLSENRNFAGQKVFRDETAYGGYTPPAYQRAWSNTPEHWTRLSKMLNDVTGGDDVKSGRINIPPEAIRLIVNSYLLPGTSGNIDKLAGALEKDKTTAKDWPVLSRMVGTAPDEREKERAVYDRLSGLRDDINVIKEYKKQGRLKEAREGVKELGNGDFDNGLRIIKGYDAFTNRLQEINRAKRIAEKKNNEVALKNIETARKRLFAEFLRRKM